MIHKMSLTRSLNGFLPAIVTPLNAKGDVDVPSLERLVRYMFEQGVDGLYVGGEIVLPLCFAPCQTVLIIPLGAHALPGHTAQQLGVYRLTSVT